MKLYLNEKTLPSLSDALSLLISILQSLTVEQRKFLCEIVLAKRLVIWFLLGVNSGIFGVTDFRVNFRFEAWLEN